MKLTPEPSVKVYSIPAQTRLDPITCIVQDFQPGQWKLIIECYLECWASFWSGMGKENLMQFFCSADTDYLLNRLAPNRATKSQKAYLTRIIDAVKEAFKTHLSTAATPAS